MPERWFNSWRSRLPSVAIIFWVSTASCLPRNNIFLLCNEEMSTNSKSETGCDTPATSVAKIQQVPTKLLWGLKAFLPRPLYNAEFNPKIVKRISISEKNALEGEYIKGFSEMQRRMPAWQPLHNVFTCVAKWFAAKLGSKWPYNKRITSGGIDNYFHIIKNNSRCYTSSDE